VALADADSSRVFWARDVGDAVQALEWSRGGELLLVRRARSLVVLGFGGRVRHAFLEQSGAAPVTAAAWAPSGRSFAFAQKAGRGSSLWVIPRLAPDAAAARRVFRGAGDFSYLAWSPDGRWLLVGWRDADQWLFIRSARVRRIEAVSRIAAQFDSARFPTVAGWCCG
jgi:dipeptidyl aminopeptidase/acylaminoacyl peptidase